MNEINPRPYRIGDTVTFNSNSGKTLNGIILSKANAVYTIKHGVDIFELPETAIVGLVQPKPK